MIQRRNQVMLSFLKLRAIVNGSLIYPLNNTKPIVIGVPENNPRVIITDGYHYTKSLKLVYQDFPVYCFRVECAIQDWQLIAGSIVLIAAYLAGLYTDILMVKVLSFLPLIYLLMFYYMNRKDFIKLVPVLR